MIAGCSRKSLDCLTGEKTSNSFSIYNNGEYKWCDFLIYHIEKYNIKSSEKFVRKAEADYSGHTNSISIPFMIMIQYNQKKIKYL